MGKFKDTIGNIAEQSAGGIIGAGMGLILEGHNDRRQIKQQQRLTDMQSQANKQLAAFNYEQQMKLWENTNYSAQMEQLGKAGLNPALIYGMSGGGGATTQAAQAAGVSGGQAHGNSGEAMGMMMNKLQMEMMKTQMENIKADTNKKNVEAGFTGGVATAEANTRIESLKQGIENAQAQEALTKIQTGLTAIQKAIAEQTEGDQVKIIDLQAQQMQQQVILIQNDASIKQETKEATIKAIKQEAVNTVIQGEAMKSSIQVNNANINKISNEILQNWVHLSIQDKQQIIQGAFLQKQIDMAPIDRIINGIGGLGNLIGNVKKGGARTFETHNHIPAQNQ